MAHILYFHNLCKLPCPCLLLLFLDGGVVFGTCGMGKLVGLLLGLILWNIVVDALRRCLVGIIGGLLQLLLKICLSNLKGHLAHGAEDGGDDASQEILTLKEIAVLLHEGVHPVIGVSGLGHLGKDSKRDGVCLCLCGHLLLRPCVGHLVLVVLCKVTSGLVVDEFWIETATDAHLGTVHDGVYTLAVTGDLEMQVGSLGVASAARNANVLTGVDFLTGVNFIRCQVHIRANVHVTIGAVVLDFHHIAAGAGLVGIDDLAVILGSKDTYLARRTTVTGADVYTAVTVRMNLRITLAVGAELADNLPLVRRNRHGPLLTRDKLQGIVDFLSSNILTLGITVEVIGLHHRGGGHLGVINLTVRMVVITLLAATKITDLDTTSLGLTDGLTVELRKVILVDDIHYLAVVVSVLGIAGTADGVKVAVYVRGGDTGGIAAEGGTSRDGAGIVIEAVLGVAEMDILTVEAETEIVVVGGGLMARTTGGLQEGLCKGQRRRYSIFYLELHSVVLPLVDE